MHRIAPFNCDSALLLIPLLLALAGLVVLSALAWYRPQSKIIVRLTSRWHARSDQSRAYQLTVFRLGCAIAAFILAFVTSNLGADSFFYCVPHR